MTPTTALSQAQILANLPPAERAKVLKDLDQGSLEFSWEFWARPNQLIPDDDSFHVLGLVAGRGFGKLLDLNTPIPTPHGWTTVEKLQSGDTIFDEQGDPTEITATYDDPAPPSCYRLTFSDGTFIDACGEHQWSTLTFINRQVIKKRQRKHQQPLDTFPANWASLYPPTTTEQIRNTLTYNDRSNHVIPLAAPLQYPTSELPLDPYTLGYWLGNGSKTASIVCTGSSSSIDGGRDEAYVLDQFNCAGLRYAVQSRHDTYSYIQIYGIRKHLVSLDLLGNKHVPDAYLHADYEQRMRLLNGLMDSDGSNSGNTEFTSTNHGLALSVLELVRSLSERPTITSRRNFGFGQEHKKLYLVRWTPSPHHPNPFLLPRKASKLCTSSTTMTRHRAILSVEPIPSTPMRCLTVDSPNSMYLAGEGMIPTHNTRASTEWVRKKALQNPATRGFIVARTSGDIRDTIISGESGLLNIHPPSEMPSWEPSKRLISWPNGSTALAISADNPDLLRGPQSHWSLAEEISTWDYVTDTSGLTAWANLLIATRLGNNPQIVASTTPKRTSFMKEFMDNIQIKQRWLLRSGSTFDNRGNLSETYLEQILGLYEGTHLARQELYGEMFEGDLEGALWTMETIESSRTTALPPGAQSAPTIAIGVDPSVSDSRGDLCGIVVSATVPPLPGSPRQFYVLEDLSIQATAARWAAEVADTARRYGAPVIVETNQGGALVRNAIHNIDPTVRVLEVHATRSKAERAAPIAMIFEQGNAHIVGNLPDLESEMTTWQPALTKKSPDRIDSMVYSIAALSNGTRSGSLIQKRVRATLPTINNSPAQVALPTSSQYRTRALRLPSRYRSR